MPDPALVIIACLVVSLGVGLFFAARAGAARRVSAAPLAQSATETPAPAQSARITGTPFQPLDASPTPDATPLPEASPTPSADEWQAWPVVPQLSAGALKIFQEGQALGNNPRAFSKIGACESAATWFLEDFDKESGYYTLGSYDYLQDTLAYFAGSYGRKSVAARDGARVSTLLSPFWSDPNQCEPNETPLDCEYRIHKPSFAIISIGTNDIDDREKFESEMRQVLDITIKHGVIPILSTKADNLEGDHGINATLTKLAAEYDLPLWNFWASLQDIPGGGLDYDGAHLTWSDNYFDQPGALRSGWAVRNLSALQVLEAMRKGTQPIPPK